MPSANPDNEIMFKEILEKYINTTAKITLSGMEHAITSVGRMSFKNRISTMTDSSAPTILGWNYYSEKCLEYLVGNRPGVLKCYRWLYILAVLIGPFMTVSAVWTIADIFNGLMALPNLIALVALSGVVAAETKQYFAEQKNF